MAKCLLCNSKKQNDIAYGKLLQKDGISVHEFCLYLSSGLVQKGEDDEGLLGFLPQHIRAESERVKKLFCCYCRKDYANIGCCEAKCRHTFHLICGIENGALNQFVGSFRSFCNRHTKKIRRDLPPKDETCCICYVGLETTNRYTNSIKAPCCKNGWFHKNCLQNFANSAGYFFKCPLCNNTEKFRERMPYSGIFIRSCDAAWELEPNAFADLMQRPSKCEAENCQHKKGREDNDQRNPLVCCETCGAVAVHKLCLPKGTINFHCAECLKIVEQRRTASEGDSGHESVPAGDDDDNDDEEVDVCYISDSDGNNSSETVDDSLKEKEAYEDDDEEIKPLQSKTIKQRFFYESSNDEESSSESSAFNKLSRKRKIITDSDESNGRSMTLNQNYDCIESDDDEADPLDFLGKIIEKKRKIQQGTDKIGSNKISSKEPLTTENSRKPVNKTRLDSPAPSSISGSKGRFTKERMQSISNNDIENNNFTKNTTEKETNTDTLDADYCYSVESDVKNNPFDVSCIAKRTRHRKSINSNNRNGQTGNTRRVRSSSSTRSDCSANTNEEVKTNALDISCIARRTRHRKSTNYPKRSLAIIGEESHSESNSSYHTPTGNKRDFRGVNHSGDDGFSSDISSKGSTSSFATVYSMPRTSLQRSRNRRLRLVSLTTDEELDENDAMKNR